MADVQTGQAQTAVAQGQSRADRVNRLRQRASRRLTPSGLVKDAAVGGVAFVAIRITWIYLNKLGTRPDLLAGMGVKLIADILGICILGVLLNRGVDIVDNALGRTTDALDRALNRMADSSERAAASAADGAVAQREIAQSQQAIAQAQRDHTAVMERVAANGDNTLTQVQTVQNYQVSQSKMIMREQQRTQRMIGSVISKLDIEVPADEEEESRHA